MKKQTKERLFDTSKCQVKFRKPRILERRNREFDQDRELTFDHLRLIDTRLQGVIFRDDPAIGFRNIGVSNIEEVSNKSDWPDVEPATSPESLKVRRDANWEETWGKGESFHQRWEVRKRRAGRTPKKYLYSRDRSQPRLLYVDRMKSQNRKSSKPKTRAPARPSKQDHSRQHYQQPAPLPRSKPKVEVVSKPIYAPPSTFSNAPVITSTGNRSSPSEKKRAFAFNEYALLLMESGEYDRSMNYFQKALDLDHAEETYKINMNRCREWLDYKKRGGRR